ncbi:MAG TPA: type II toxin-antitoxin system HicB family antitoxin [Nevskiaceae bacterium]|nr:type II toxin-antitoxin system HicB family antitoxin [Nevskiaceae bacterium]
MAKQLKYTAIYIKEADGGYSVSVPSLPGCFSQGDTLQEAQKNIAEAIESHLESFRLDGKKAPRSKEERASKITVSYPKLAVSL